MGISVMKKSPDLPTNSGFLYKFAAKFKENEDLIFFCRGFEALPTSLNGRKT